MDASEHQSERGGHHPQHGGWTEAWSCVARGRKQNGERKRTHEGYCPRAHRHPPIDRCDRLNAPSSAKFHTYETCNEKRPASVTPGVCRSAAPDRLIRLPV